MSDDDIKQARRWFAEELRSSRRWSDPTVVKAFATVPRERFVGPGPLRMLSLGTCRTIGRRRRKPGGRISRRVDRLRRATSAEQWSAEPLGVRLRQGGRRSRRAAWSIWAAAWATTLRSWRSLSGGRGKVSAIEIDEVLAESAREALAPWRHVTVINGEGANNSFRRKRCRGRQRGRPILAQLGCAA